MKLKRWVCKKTIVLWCGLLMAATSFAQQGTVLKEDVLFLTENWFASGSLGNQWLVQGNTTGKEFVVRGAAGTWLNEFSGVRAHLSAGMRKLDGLSSTRYYMLGADYLLNVLPLMGDYDFFNRFSLNVSVGAAYNMLNYRKDNGDKVNKPSVNLGLQTGYDFTSRWGIFAEAMFNAMDKFYSKGGSGVSLGSDLSIGFRYRFRKHNYEKLSVPPVEKEDDGRLDALSGAVERLNGEVNELRKRLEEERLSAKGRTVMLAPAREQASVDVFFDKFSSFVSEEQRRKIDAVGEWMKNNSFEVRIVAFSDNLSDKDADEKLRNNRTEAIRILLTEIYDIGKERITVLRAEELGYKNLTGCNAKIQFIEK